LPATAIGRTALAYYAARDDRRELPYAELTRRLSSIRFSLRGPGSRRRGESVPDLHQGLVDHLRGDVAHLGGGGSGARDSLVDG